MPGRLFSPASVCLSACLCVNRITQKLMIKSSCNFTKWLDIIRGPIVQVLVVIWILKEFYHCDIANCKGSVLAEFGNSPNVCRLTDLRFNKLKAALGPVWAPGL